LPLFAKTVCRSLGLIRAACGETIERPRQAKRGARPRFCSCAPTCSYGCPGTGWVAVNDAVNDLP
jgi:hypothetical protein